MIKEESVWRSEAEWVVGEGILSALYYPIVPFCGEGRFAIAL